MTKKREQCYVGIFSKIDCIESRITEIKEQLSNLKQDFLNVDNPDACPDELEAEQALLEIMNEAAIGALLDTDPQGDA